MRRFVTVSIASFALAFAMLAWGTVATADPTGAKNSFSIPVTCDGESLLVVVNGNGTFTPAHVIGSTAVFIPESFDVTFTFTPPGGVPQTETETESKSNPHGDVTCVLDFTFTAPEGTFTGTGTVSGFLTPNR